MNKLALVTILTSSTVAVADAPGDTQPAPGAPAPVQPAPAPAYVQPAAMAASPFVVAYDPPPVTESDGAHHGVTLELSVGAASTPLENSGGSASFAIGGWITHDLALAFRITAAGSYMFAGASLQYYATPRFWAGAGIGSLAEETMDSLGDRTRASGGGGFARVGYDLAMSGPHALYLAAEVQGGGIDNQQRGLALLSIGYQLQ